MADNEHQTESWVFGADAHCFCGWGIGGRRSVDDAVRHVQVTGHTADVTVTYRIQATPPPSDGDVDHHLQRRARAAFGQDADSDTWTEVAK